MSFDSMAREEFGCDYLECPRNFDSTPGHENALIMTDGTIKAFCAKHCEKLKAEGFRLVALSEIHELMEKRKAATARKNTEERERKFLEDLKNSVL